jgi:hypothetical protein
MTDDNKPTAWIVALPPISFGLTAEGELKIDYGVSFGLPGIPDARMGLLLPAEQVTILRRALVASQTIQETLAAKRPPLGAH